MSKLHKLKSWLSLVDAARHLSTIFEEVVREEDLLQLALDLKLTISVVFPDPPLGVIFKPIADKDVEFREVRSLNSSEILRIPTEPIVLARDGSFLQKQNLIFTLDDNRAYDLAMIGGEVEKLYREYWLRVGGERNESINIDGTFVRDGELYICLQAALPRDRGDVPSYYPLGGLPEDSLLVATPSSLSQLEKLVASPLVAPLEKPLASRERTSFLNIIGALLELTSVKESSIISEMLERHPNASGIKKRTLEEKFAEAKRSLRTS